MAKQTKQVEEQNPEANGITVYDKYLCDVNREAGARGAVTKSVTVRKIQREKMPVHPNTVNSLNASQDHQNPSTDGHPVIVWYFPSGTAKTGDIFKANDIHATIEDEESGADVKLMNPDGTHKITGINVTDRKISGYTTDKKGKQKPVFEDSKGDDIAA